jgi:hypothetical protein
VDRAEQEDEGGKNSGKTRHRGAPGVLAGAQSARRNQALVRSGMRQSEAPFRSFPATYGPTGISRGQAYSIVRAAQRLRAAGYCFASGAASTALQAGGNEAIVIGGFGFGGVGDGFGWRTESLNQ